MFKENLLRMKRTKLKTFAALSIAVMCGTAMFTGCRVQQERPEATAENVIIQYWHSGDGVDYVKLAADNFNASQSDYVVYPIPNASAGAMVETFGHADIDETTLYMATLNGIGEDRLNKYAEPLNEVFEADVDGKGVKIKEKINPYFLDSLYDSTGTNVLRSTYGGGWCGLVYNSDILGDEDFPVPVTSDELYDLCISLRNDKGIKPFIHFKNSNYLEYVYQTWAVQYDGLDDYYNTFFPLKDGNELNSQKILVRKDGRKKALDAFAKVLTPENTYDGSNSYTYIEAQTNFVNGKAAMMANGGWLIREMKVKKDNLRMMKTPVISSIREKCPSIGSDTELRALIRAIDVCKKAEDVALTGNGYDCAAEDVKRVWEARNLMFSNFDQHVVVMPNYSVAKKAGKEFLKYFYSDKCINDMVELTHLALPFTTSDGSVPDMTGWKKFEKDMQVFTETMTPILYRTGSMSPIFSKGGARPFGKLGGTPNIPLLFSTTNPADRKTSDEMWELIVSTHNAEWNNYKVNAGL